MYRRLQKVVTHIILAFSKKKIFFYHFIQYFLLFLGTIVNEMHKLFYSKSLGGIALDAFNALFVCLTAAVHCGANKEKKILIRTAAVRPCE